MAYYNFCKLECAKYSSCQGISACTGWARKPQSLDVVAKTVHFLRKK